MSPKPLTPPEILAAVERHFGPVDVMEWGRYTRPWHLDDVPCAEGEVEGTGTSPPPPKALPAPARSLFDGDVAE